MTGDPRLPGQADTTAYFNPSLDVLYISGCLPTLNDERVVFPTRSMQRFLDIVSWAQRIMVTGRYEFRVLVENLMKGNEALSRFPALRSVDALHPTFLSDVSKSNSLRCRVCSDTMCKEPVTETYRGGSWKMHSIGCSYVEISDSGAVLYRPCREMVASLPDMINPKEL
jgi:hypothetical protein